VKAVTAAAEDLKTNNASSVINPAASIIDPASGLLNASNALSAERAMPASGGSAVPLKGFFV